jgi:Ala-tRNA(Pro) deacylase
MISAPVVVERSLKIVMGNNMQDPFQKIIELLDSQDIKYEILEHEPVYTSEQAAKVRNESINSGAKSLLLRAGGYFVLAVLPGGKRLSSKKVKKFLGLKDLRFATPQEVKEAMGCEIGSCYPLGKIIGVRTIIDNALLENEDISFNPGLHEKTIKLKLRDYLSLAAAEITDISE